SCSGRWAVPEPVDPAERVLVPLLLALTAVTGLVDAASYLSFGHVFTANMTGNVVFLGFAIAGAPGLSLGRSSLALAAFAAGAVAGGRIAAVSAAARNCVGRAPHSRSRPDCCWSRRSPASDSTRRRIPGES